MFCKALFWLCSARVCRGFPLRKCGARHLTGGIFFSPTGTICIGSVTWLGARSTHGAQNARDDVCVMVKSSEQNKPRMQRRVSFLPAQMLE